MMHGQLKFFTQWRRLRFGIDAGHQHWLVELEKFVGNFDYLIRCLTGTEDDFRKVPYAGRAGCPPA